jgi:hypothetical protein
MKPLSIYDRIVALFTTSSRGQRRVRQRQRKHLRPYLECLEARLVPAINLLVDASGATAGVTSTFDAPSHTTTFTATAGGAHLNIGDVVTARQVGNVVVDSGSAGTEAGDITINTGITSPMTHPYSLTFQTGSGAGVVGNITVNGDFVVLKSGDTLPMAFLARNNLVLNGTLVAGGPRITLTATNGAISQTAGSVKLTTQLNLTAAAGVGSAAAPLVTSAVGHVQALDGTGGVFLHLSDTAIGFGGSTPGIQVTGSGDISVSGLAMTVSNAVEGPGNVSIRSNANLHAGGAVTLSPGVSVTSTTAANVTLTGGTVTIPATAHVGTGTGGNVAISADSLNLGGTISTGASGSVTLAPLDRMPVVLCGNGSGTGLAVTQADLDLITTGAVQVGDATQTQSLSVTAPVNVAAPATTLALLSAGSVSQTVSGTALSAPNLQVTARGAIGSSSQPLTFSASTLTANTSAGNANQFLASAGTSLLSHAGALNAGKGSITLASGTLQISAAANHDAIANSSALTVNSPATLDLAGNSESINGLGGNGTVTNSSTSAATLTVGSSNGSGTFAGVLKDGSGQLALTKAGSGSETLTGSNHYSGSTTVAAGTLLVNGTTAAASATTVAAGATLAGTGTGAGTLGVSGTLAPGSGGPGILTTGSATFAFGSILSIAVGGTTAGNGASDYSQLDVTGNVVMGPALTLHLSAVGGFVPKAGETFTILHNTGSGTLSGTFGGLPEGATIPNFLGSGLNATITYAAGANHNDVALTVGTVKKQPAFSNLLSPTIVYGTATTTLSGHLSAGSAVPPANETVSITIGSVTRTASLNSSGNFSVAFPTATLGVAGSPYTVSYAYAGDGSFSSVSNSSTRMTVTPAPLTAVVTVNNKVYDGTTAAIIASETFTGTIYGSDVVTVTGGTATFATANAGPNQTVTVTGLSLSGASASNYKLSSTTAITTASITPMALTVSGITAADKDYDGTTAATLDTSNATLVGVVPGDTVTLDTSAATGSFASQDVGSAIPVTVAGLTISGAPVTAGDYTLTQPTTNASIKPLTLTVSGITASDKAYDGTPAATLDTTNAALVGVVPGDSVTLDTSAATGTFASIHPGTDIPITVSGLAISGAPVTAGDYILTQPTTTASISKATPTLTWNTPSPLAPSTPLSSAQLDATASVPGTFVYSPPAGTILSSGNQTLAVTFTPADDVDYNGATGTVTLVVLNPGVGVYGSTLYVVTGSQTNDQVAINPTGSSTSGSTGLVIGGTINGSAFAQTYSQAFSAIVFVGATGNCSFQMASTLTIDTTVSAADGNDTLTLGSGNNTVTLGNGSDNVSTGNGNDVILLGNGSDTITGGTGNKAITAGNGANMVRLGNGNDSVTLGNGNDTVVAGSGDDTVTVGNGNDSVTLGDGDNVVVEGIGSDKVQAGNGANLVVAGLGQHTVQLGNGSDILIDGAAMLTQPGDALQQVLQDWKLQDAAADAIDSRLEVTYNNAYANQLTAGNGLDWFFATFAGDSTNRKPTDRLN